MNATALDYDLLATFVAVADATSFSRAAKKLGVTKGTVSRAIARLESLVHAELLHRTTHRVALSTAGTALYERVAPHLTALEGALGALPERAEAPSGELRLTAPHDFAAIVLPGLVAEFALRYPDIRFDLRVSNARLDLVAERIDLAIRAGGPLKDSALKTRRLSMGKAGFYASPAYLARRGEPRAAGDPKHDWVMMRGMLALLRLPKSFTPRMLVDDILTLRNLLCEGAGVGALPSFVTTEAIAAGNLKATLTSLPLVPTHLHLVYPSSGQVPRKVNAFAEFLLERLKARPLGG